MTINPLVARLRGLYQSLISLLQLGQSPFLLLIRLDWGWQFAQSGWGKLHNLDQVTTFFTSLGLPQPHLTALFVALVEFVGGIVLALGIGSRLIALILFINMTVAYWTADKEAFGHFFNDPGKFAAADPFTFWFVALIVLLFGPGKFAVDTLLSRLFSGQVSSSQSRQNVHAAVEAR